MSRYHSYLNSAKKILEQNDGQQPFHYYIKDFFRQHKKYGSKDRKQIAELCYCFFRLGKAGIDLPAEERILTGVFLCSVSSNEILEELRPGWNEKISATFEEKCSMINAGFIEPKGSIPGVFPWKEELSDAVDNIAFCKSFFIQPDLFIRLRPGKENTVRLKLEQAGIQFKIVTHTCLSFANSTKIDSVIEPDKEAVIQDYNSQQTGEFLKLVNIPGEEVSQVWDCCSASGGKSIMAYDLIPHIELTVSDARESILINLKKRFERAGIKKYKSFVADLAIEPSSHQLSALSFPLSAFTSHPSPFTFNLIICDVPCTGSGTWSRTPEQLYYFDEKKIDEYASLQKKILSNVMTYLKPGGHLVYITCSVFRKENEDVVNYITENFSMQLIKMEILKGYNKKADSMFAALLQERF